MPKRTLVHCALMGVPYGGKSSFAATFPKPMLVISNDPLGKETPYVRRGILGEPFTGVEGQRVTPIMSRKRPDMRTITIEHYLDVNPRRPVAHAQLMARLQALPDEVAVGQWATVVFDGVTFAELNCRKHYQYSDASPYRGSKEPRRWFAAATDDLEEILMVQLGALACNVVVIAHVDREKDEMLGTFLHNPAAPGRLRTRFSAAFPETYHMQVSRDPKTGETLRRVQTQPDGRFYAGSVILEAPDGCEPDYNALWVNYDARAAADEALLATIKVDEPNA